MASHSTAEPVSSNYNSGANHNFRRDGVSPRRIVAPTQNSASTSSTHSHILSDVDNGQSRLQIRQTGEPEEDAETDEEAAIEGHKPQYPPHQYYHHHHRQQQKKSVSGKRTRVGRRQYNADGKEWRFEERRMYSKTPVHSEAVLSRVRSGWARVVGQVVAVFILFSQRSTVHGLNHMAQARGARRRFFWLTVSLVASVGFFVNLYYLMDKYLQRPILTNVYHDSQEFVFPDVTFCLVNSIYFPPQNTTAYRELFRHFAVYDRLLASGQTFTRSVRMSDYLYMERSSQYTHPAWSAIVNCRYMQEECTADHFDVHRLWPWGACYTLNATKLNRTRSIESRAVRNIFRPDLRLIIYKALDRPEEVRHDLHNGLTVPPGVALMIHEPNTRPPIGESAIVNSCTQVDLKVAWIKHLPDLGKCVPERPMISYFNLHTNQSTIFRLQQSDCIENTVQQQLARECGCLHHSMGIATNISHLAFCMNGQFDDNYLEACFRRALNNIAVEGCFRDLCEHYSISRVVSQSDYPGVRERFTHDSWLEMLATIELTEMEHFENQSDLVHRALLPAPANNAAALAKRNLLRPTSLREAVEQKRADLLNTDFVERNFMMIRVMPSSLFSDRVIESHEYPLSRLLSDLGGCVGLWIGASLITLFECFDLLMDMTDSWNFRAPPHGSQSVRNRPRPPMHEALLEQQRYWTTPEAKLLGVQGATKFLVTSSSNQLHTIPPPPPLMPPLTLQSAVRSATAAPAAPPYIVPSYLMPTSQSDYNLGATRLRMSLVSAHRTDTPVFSMLGDQPPLNFAVVGDRS